MRRALTSILMATILAVPAVADAQVIDPMPPVPCPWWDCGGTTDVVVQEYRLEATISNQIATTRITETLRNDGRGLAQGEFLHPIPRGAVVTDLTLWIDGEPVTGTVLEGDEARQTYEEIVRRTLDPALLEFVDDDLLRLSVFPIPAGETRKVEIEYQQVLDADGGLVRYVQPMGREHGSVEIESVVARIDIEDDAGLKTIHSPTHAVSIDRTSELSAVVGFEGSGAQQSDLAVYYSIDDEPVSLDVLSYRDGTDGWFVLLASPGLVADDVITPKDLAIVIDVSGSMEGDKLAQAKQAATEVLGRLNVEDRFAVIAFSTGIDEFTGELVAGSRADDAIAWVNRLAAGGGTNIERSLDRAFGLAEPGRPLYVLFLTDGLPTEGIVDTRQILDALAPHETTSLFAFGVGFDVDTVLLDSLTEDHHGTSQYVVPGEQIDEAVTSLYAKVAAPVLTNVTLEVSGVNVWDLQPGDLPDVFSGEQLVVAGRYEGSGPADVTLSGRIRGVETTIRYDDVSFSASGGEATAPGLWATRKIGSLLRQIRLEGPDAETIDQIVRISIRHGIVTPYTSYLVTEPETFGEEAIGLISERAAAATTTLAPSGEAAVTAADAAAGFSAAEQAAPVSEAYADLIVLAGGRAMRLVGSTWTDTAYDPAVEPVEVAFGSADYFRLAATDPSLAAALGVGPSVIVMFQGTAYQVVGQGETPEPLPEVISQPAEDRPASETQRATVALLSALAAVAGVALLAARR